MMKQFRRDRNGICASDREAQGGMGREGDNCSRARAGGADACAPNAAAATALSAIVATIASRIIEMSGGHNRNIVVRVR
jgi:hypothetical protein